MDVFEMLDAPVQAELLEAMQGHPVTEVFAAMDPDDRVALLDELPAQVAAKLLQGLGERERRETNVLLGYSSGVVGHVMSRTSSPPTPVSASPRRCGASTGSWTMWKASTPC